MKHKIWLTSIALAIGITLSGCGATTSGYSNDPSAPPEKVEERAITVVEYRGHDLFCLETQVLHGPGTFAYTCDFARFYGEPSTQGSSLPKAKVKLTVTTYRSHDLYCFAYQTGHGRPGYECDFNRFYDENKRSTS